MQADRTGDLKPEAHPQGRLAWTLLIVMFACPVLNFFAVQQSDSLLADFSSNGVQSLAALLAGFFFLRAQYLSADSHPRCTWAWWLLSLGACANALAAMLYLLMVWFELPKFPSPADFFLIFFILFSIGGLWTLPRRRLPRWQLLVLGTGVTCAILLVLLLLWKLLGADMMGFYSQARPPKLVLAVVYQTLDLVLVTSALWAFLRRDRDLVAFWPLAMLCAAFLTLAFADGLQVLFMANHIWLYRAVVEHAWCLVSVFLGLAGFLRPRRILSSELLDEADL
jgi:hypothetical protein